MNKILLTALMVISLTTNAQDMDYDTSIQSEPIHSLYTGFIALRNSAGPVIFYAPNISTIDEGGTLGSVVTTTDGTKTEVVNYVRDIVKLLNAITPS